jgi:dTDP-4-amino-4,6-dideoxygalactose transaminase
MRRIPVGDFPIGVEERAAINRVLDSGRISESIETRAFEREFAAYLGVKYCIAVSSGTSALMVALKATEYAGLIPSDARVLLPAFTFVADANAVELCGMTPVFGDVYERTYCLRPTSIVGKYIQLALPVHLFGYNADMAAFKLFANKHSTYAPLVVEDAAEALGSTRDGQKAGTFGLWSIFSFYIAHTIQAGEMGCICTDDDEIARICRSVKAHGRLCDCPRCTRPEGKCPHLDKNPRFTVQYIGLNAKVMEFQAAIARLQLARIEENIAKRRRNFAQLKAALAPIEGRDINTIYEQEGMVPMAFPIVLQKEGIRNNVMAELEYRGVECRSLFACIPTQQPAYAKYRDEYAGKLPISEWCGANGFYVGCHQHLTESDMEFIGKQIVEAIKNE